MDIVKTAVSYMTLRRLYRYLVKRMLGGFLIPDFTTEQLDVHLINGTVQLTDVLINAEKVNEMLRNTGSGILLRSGSVSKIRLKVPWGNILRESSQLFILELRLNAYLEAGSTVRGESAGKDVSSSNETNFSESVSESFKALTQLVLKVLTNLEACVESVVVRIDEEEVIFRVANVVLRTESEGCKSISIGKSELQVGALHDSVVRFSPFTVKVEMNHLEVIRVGILIESIGLAVPRRRTLRSLLLLLRKIRESRGSEHGDLMYHSVIEEMGRDNRTNVIRDQKKWYEEIYSVIEAEVTRSERDEGDNSSLDDMELAEDKKLPLDETTSDISRTVVSVRVGEIRLRLFTEEGDCPRALSLLIKGLTFESNMLETFGMLDSVSLHMCPFTSPSSCPSSSSASSSVYESVVDSDASFGDSELQDSDADSSIQIAEDDSLETLFFTGRIGERRIDLEIPPIDLPGNLVFCLPIVAVAFSSFLKAEIQIQGNVGVDLNPQLIANISHLVQAAEDALFVEKELVVANEPSMQFDLSIAFLNEVDVNVSLGNGHSLNLSVPKPFFFNSLSGGIIPEIWVRKSLHLKSIRIAFESFSRSTSPVMEEFNENTKDGETWTAVRGRPLLAAPPAPPLRSSKSVAEQSSEMVNKTCREQAGVEIVVCVESGKMTDDAIEFLNFQLKLQSLADQVAMAMGGNIPRKRSHEKDISNLAITLLVQNMQIHTIHLAEIALRVCFLHGLPLVSVLVTDLELRMKSDPASSPLVGRWGPSADEKSPLSEAGSSSHVSCLDEERSVYKSQVEPRFRLPCEAVLSATLEAKSLEKNTARICLAVNLRGLHAIFSPSLIIGYKNFFEYLAPPVTLVSHPAPLITAPPRPTYTVYIVRATECLLESQPPQDLSRPSSSPFPGKVLVFENLETSSGILSTVDPKTAAGICVNAGKITLWLSRKFHVSSLSRNLADNGFVPVLSLSKAVVTVSFKPEEYVHLDLELGSVRTDVRADTHNGLICAVTDILKDIEIIRQEKKNLSPSLDFFPPLPPVIPKPFVLKEDFVTASRGRGGSRFTTSVKPAVEGGSARWLVDPSQLVVVNDHLAVAPGKLEERLGRAKQEAMQNCRNNTEFRTMSVALKINSVRLFVHSGLDWQGSEFFLSGLVRGRRSSSLLQSQKNLVCVEMESLSVDLVHLAHEKDRMEEKIDLSVTVNELKVRDGVLGSVYQYVLTHWAGPASSVQSPSAFTLGFSQHGSTAKAQVSLRPLSITIDQDTLEFISQYVSQASASNKTGDEEEVIVSSSESTEFEVEEGGGTESVSEPSRAPAGHANKFLLQSLSVSSVHVEINYKSKRLSLSRLRRGDPLQILNLVPVLEGFQVVLSEVKMADVIDREALLRRLMDSWAKDINRAQIMRSLGSVTPLKCFSNISSGVFDLINQPLKQLRRKDGHLSRGLLRGFTSFIRTLTIESLNLADVVVSTTQNALEYVDSATGKKVEGPPSSLTLSDDDEEEDAKDWMTVERGARERMLDPASALEGIRTGRDALIRGVKTPGLLQPAIGATQAVSVVLRGARSTVDSGKHKADTERKYKRPYTQEEVLSDNLPPRGF